MRDPGQTLELDGASLTLEQLRFFESLRPTARISAAARTRMEQSVAAVIATVESGRVAYGINTGFGAFANRVIPAAQTRKLQLNLVRSHACGVGEPLPAPIVRLMLLLKANALAAGFSGIRPAVVDALLALLNADVLPVIPASSTILADCSIRAFASSSRASKT